MAELEQPIIIKKITKVEGGHHGGAWKVAYADFVTAMMAFFLLLWLLSSASDGQLSGIADYFSPTIGISGAMGIGFEGGLSDSVEEGKRRTDLAPPGIVSGQPPQGLKQGEPKKKVAIESPQGEQMLFDEAQATLEAEMEENEDLRELRDNIQLEQTDEGLKIKILDTEKDPMFYPGHTRLTDAGERLLANIGEVIYGMPNHISINGHTDAVPFTRRRNYSNWELSAGRANSARRHLVAEGMEDERVSKVQGYAANELLLPAQPEHAKNRRIEIILLKQDHMVPAFDAQPTGSQFNPTQDMIEDSEVRDGASTKLRDKELEDIPFEPVTVIPDTPLQKESLDEAQGVIQFVPR